jgi:hypothetical protein
MRSTQVSDHAINEVVDRLSTRFPHVYRQDLQLRVQDALRSFTTATIPDFLPILVERQVSAHLRAGLANGLLDP